MDTPAASSQPEHTPVKTPTLQIDFSWRKYQTLITDLDKSSEPLYIIDTKSFKTPNLIFKSTKDDSVIGTGTVHPISINADYEIHGRKGTLKALKRFKTSYTHLSTAYAASPDAAPATMTWASTGGLKNWDFVCLDEQQSSVARISINVWATRKIGKIEFLGPRAGSPACREEMLVTGATLLFCMILRSANILSLFGAIFASPGPIEKGKEGEGRELTQLGGPRDEEDEEGSEEEVAGAHRKTT